MKARRIRLLFPALLLLALVACVSTAPQPAGILARTQHGAPPFPVGFEVQASLQLSRDGVAEDYLLAMSTATNNFSAAFLSPQGLPVYNVTGRGGRLHSARQTTMGALLDPRLTLGYLVLIFAPDSEIGARIQDSWEYQASAGKRHFHNGIIIIDIDYRGEGPWHHLATLNDKHNNFHLTVRILEAALVLPQ